MATSQPSSPSADSPRLILSNASLRNNAFDCDALSLHYRLSTPTDGTSKLQHVTQISRWDAHLGREILVAEWAKKAFKNDQLKMCSEVRSSGEAEFVPVNDVLRKTTSTIFSVVRTFTANNGKHYTWKADPISMKLYCEDNKQEVASYHQPHLVFSHREAYIELFYGYEDIIDYRCDMCHCRENSQGE
ncbi:hypothetical protein DFH11DRAFT_1728222 [Phellopilus nigrolimitatus]|nr:hypothetical protein DFH11DRAFT_1728222 [Phellopilus nigrolimitatus]